MFTRVCSDYEYPEDEDLDHDPSQEDYYYDYPSLFQEDTTQRSQSTQRPQSTQRSQSTPFQRPQSTERSATTEASVLQEEPEPTTGTIVTNI